MSKLEFKCPFCDADMEIISQNISIPLNYLFGTKNKLTEEWICMNEECQCRLEINAESVSMIPIERQWRPTNE